VYLDLYGRRLLELQQFSVYARFPRRDACPERLDQGFIEALSSPAVFAREPGSEPMAQILLVEDEPRVAATLRKALERAGHSVLTAGDGRDALGIMQKSKVDLVIADIVMPNVDGLELIKEIRRTDQMTKILAISGEAGWMPGGYLRAVGVFGADYALKKPFSTRVFIQAVDRLLNTTSRIGPPDEPAPGTLP
jgi:CheY-like chemotaxis protein